MKKHLAMTALALAVGFSYAGGAYALDQAFDFNAAPFGGKLVKDAKAIDFSYQAEVDFNGPKFDLSGVAFFGTFRKDLSSPPIPGTGLGEKYGLYAEFVATGTRTNIAPGVNEAAFNDLTFKLRLDPNLDTGSNTFTPGVAGGNETHFASGDTSDDITLFTGKLIAGQAHHFNTLDRGSFDLLLDAQNVDRAVLQGLGFTPTYPQVRFTGVNTFLEGVIDPPGSVTDLDLRGSGNLTVVPEPGIPLLLGGGLLALIGIRKLRSM